MADSPSYQNALKPLRDAWEAGFRLCRSYGDNHAHFDGEQKERHWQAFLLSQPGQDAQRTPLWWFERGWRAGFQEAMAPDLYPDRNRCQDAWQELIASSPASPEA